MSIEARIEEKLDSLANAVADLRVSVRDVATKMDFLVGADGTNGLVRDLAERVGKVERRQAYTAGASGAVGVLCGVVVEWFQARLFR